MSLPVEPNEVVQLVEEYVDNERRSADKFDNKTALDESGISDLHRLAARIYALGHSDGTCVANERHNRRRSRERKDQEQKP
ncbi:hypothetical protein [Rhodococcus sp. B10]|uniref:hypothetical protein n=1 Tax=Rhodococcus sp. B10 TaxID=2695876 RepID=UPI001431CDE7|nr:hypothetical protein [Rhodococcus sp. B10]NIL77638.1 hypothetical protein [Rhodococcus sp. B10]